ncbi:MULTISPECIES: hypothetical protein [Bacillus]|uniref:Uncharacterized protein n=4 Tax=Bacillus cereus group TaxID=86661 RepID=A0A9X8X9R1_BACCE|nr:MULTISPECIES: hypothetical protein [Bacillus]MBJ6720890.1 hypothetical protein [Bacillus sp. PR5]MDV8109522.1 hypothetical protein [Bacillus sp. BAU-SS-2023]TKV48098.1 hypothetical protein C1I58_09180 [Bacillus sp. PIC28]CGG07651.1 Uncharacterised protein [Streptococcus pneumoniae]ALZ61232.1 hypothetical protein FORC13_2171 [Bacillus cereus]
MEIYYCDKWSNIKKKPWNIIDENAAKTLHENRHSYTAVLSDGEQPKYLVNVTEKWVSVSFLDDFLRKYLHYDFIVKEDNRLFLRTIMYWEYDGDTQLKSMILGYQENGHIAMEQKDSKTGEVEERETKDDVSRNWDTFPEFGQYLYLCKEER